MHLKISKHVMIFFMMILCSFLNAAETLTPAEEKAMSEISDFRLNLGLSETCKAAVDSIDAYLEKINGPEYENTISDEIKLCINNILVWEKYNYLYEEDIACPLLEPLIKGQYEIVKKWFKEHKKDPHNKWLYTTSGDILSCCMQFLSIPTAMSEGLTIKGFYDDAVELDGDFVFALNNLAQWYYYAPFFAGGSEKKAQKMFLHAYEVARTVPEKFYAAVLLSQSYYESKDYTDCIKMLNEAEKIFPGSRCVKFYKKLNYIGTSYFDYTTNRKKYDKKLKEKGLL